MSLVHQGAIAPGGDAPLSDTSATAEPAGCALPALQALCLLARLHHVAADPALLQHQLGLSAQGHPGPAELTLAARHLGLKARLSTTRADRLTLCPLPALARLHDGRWVVLAQCDGQRVLFQDPVPSPGAEASRPTIEPLSVFAEQWTGQLLLVTSRATLAGELARFDFSWFSPGRRHGGATGRSHPRGVPTAAQTLMVIVPDEAEVTAEVVIDNKYIGFVQPGQPAAVKLETFPFTRYGTVEGEVIRVARDAVQDETRGAIFPATVRLKRSHIDVEGRPVRLAPGMNLTVEVRTGARRVVDYLLSPMAQALDEAARER